MSRDGASGAVTEHGGRLAAARLLFPGAPEPFLDLSTGINPRPYHLPRFPADAFTRLPEPEALWELQTIAAAAYGAASPEMVAAMQRSRQGHVENAQAIWIRAWRAAPKHLDPYEKATADFDAPRC